MDDLEEAVFRAPPKQFTAAREALIAALKAAGRGDEVKVARALRRPSVPVWLWNRLLLDGDKSARELLRVANLLGEAIDGAKLANLHEATNELRAAALALVGRARALAEELGVGFSIAQERELTELVQALPWNAGAREEAARGRLREAPPPVDPLEAMRLVAGAPHKEKPSQKPTRDDAALLEAESALAGAESLLAEATAAHASANRELDRARAGVARAEKLLWEAQAQAAETQRQERAARAAVDEARARLEAVRR